MIKKSLRKPWSEEKVRKYIGEYRASFFAYASDEILRKNAASGGVITAILAGLLKSGDIDGALVCRTKITDGRLRPEFFIAEEKEGLLSAQGSKYSAVNFTSDALPLIREFRGKLAVVALPCDVTNLRRACEKEAGLSRKAVLVISLFCGHNSRPELTDMVLDKLKPQGAELSGFRYRQGHWRGSMRAEFEDGKTIEKPFSFFSDYQNLYFFCQQKCHHCSDHTGYDGDISVGDIWSLRMKDNPIKHSAVILRTDAGQTAFQKVFDMDALVAIPEPIAEICQGQARSMPFHYNVSARAKAGKKFGIKIKDTVHESVRWNDYLVAWMVLFNERLSRSIRGQRVIRSIPRFVLKFFLYVMKTMESF